MPITVQIPEGLFTIEAQVELFAALTESILRINGASANAFVRRHLIGDIHEVPFGRSFAAGKPEPYANVTLRVPHFSLAAEEQRQAFVTEITDVIQRLSAGRLGRDRIYVNMIHGDGFRGIGGKAYSNGDLLSTAMAHAP